MTLSPYCTLQNVIQTQKCKPCQLYKQSTPFLAGAFYPTQSHPTCPKVQTWLQFNHRARTSSKFASLPGLWHDRMFTIVHRHHAPVESVLVPGWSMIELHWTCSGCAEQNHRHSVERLYSPVVVGYIAPSTTRTWHSGMYRLHLTNYWLTLIVNDVTAAETGVVIPSDKAWIDILAKN